ncbi:MAG: hypothetical protein VB778_02140 [Nitrospinaceae bacterium]|jgi:hypothetical protein
MKRLAIVLIVAVASFCLASYAFAGALAPGATAKCNNAKTITIANTGGSADWGDANASIWKSSNFTTVPISLSPGSNQGFSTNGGGAAGNSYVKMPSKHSMGQKSVTLTGQTNFSRGDSIGDLSGEVRITNTGTSGLSVTCG